MQAPSAEQVTKNASKSEGMARPRAGPYGTVSNLNRLCRTALVVDGLLATGRKWQDIAREVSDRQYKARGYTPPKPDLVRQYFSLEKAPALDPGYGSSLAYPAALALEYPEVRPLVIAPLLDLLFGLDLPKADQAERKQRFDESSIRAAEKHAKPGVAEFMQLLNQIAPGRRRGRASGLPIRPHWSLYQTLLIARPDLISILFEQRGDAFGRRLRPIEEEVAQLADVQHIDALALLYGLMLEALELCDENRLDAAKRATLKWLPKVHELPECRRIAPLLERAVLHACSQAFPKRFSRVMALDRVRPGTWRERGGLVSVEEMAYGFPSNADSIEFLKLRDLDIEQMNKRIEAQAQLWLRARSVHMPSARQSIPREPVFKFPFRARSSIPLRGVSDFVLSSLPDAAGWREGRFWVMQRGTRCALTATGQEGFPLVFADFGHMRGDPVTDRPISSMPWILADWRWVEPAATGSEAGKRIVQFLKKG
jgi:hypothetical protein